MVECFCGILLEILSFFFFIEIWYFDWFYSWKMCVINESTTLYDICSHCIFMCASWQFFFFFWSLELFWVHFKSSARFFLFACELIRVYSEIRNVFTGTIFSVGRKWYKLSDQECPSSFNWICLIPKEKEPKMLFINRNDLSPI